MAGLFSLLPSSMFSSFNQTKSRPLSKEVKTYFKDNIPLILDVKANYLEKYYAMLISTPPALEKTPLEKWVEAILKVAFNVSDLNGEFKIGQLVESIGYHNAFALMTRGYQLALQNTLVGNSDKIKKRQLVEAFGNAVEELATKYPKDFLTVDVINLPFKNDTVSAPFLKELDKTEEEEKLRQQMCARIGIGAITLFGMGVAAMIIGSSQVSKTPVFDKANNDPNLTTTDIPPFDKDTTNAVSKWISYWSSQITPPTVTPFESIFSEPRKIISAPGLIPFDPPKSIDPARTYWVESTIFSTILAIAGFVRPFLVRNPPANTPAQPQTEPPRTSMQMPPPVTPPRQNRSHSDAADSANSGGTLGDSFIQLLQSEEAHLDQGLSPQRLNRSAHLGESSTRSRSRTSSPIHSLILPAVEERRLVGATIEIPEPKFTLILSPENVIKLNQLTAFNGFKAHNDITVIPWKHLNDKQKELIKELHLKELSKTMYQLE